MLRLTFMLRRKPSMSREDMQRYWLEEHAALVEHLRRAAPHRGKQAIRAPARARSLHHLKPTRLEPANQERARLVVRQPRLLRDPFHDSTVTTQCQERQNVRLGQRRV